MKRNERLPKCNWNDQESVREYNRAWRRLHADDIRRSRREKYVHKPRIYKKKACVVCGKLFVPTSPVACICSSECREKRRVKWIEASMERQRIRRSLKPKTVHKCRMCGKEFEIRSQHQMYCSAECRLARARPVKAAYAQKHAEEIRKCRSKYKKSEKGKAATKRHAERHKDKFAERARRYYWRHREKLLAKKSTYNKASREKAKADLSMNILSTESLAYIRERERVTRWIAEHPDEYATYSRKSKRKRALIDANNEVDAAWFSAGFVTQH